MSRSVGANSPCASASFHAFPVTAKAFSGPSRKERERDEQHGDDRDEHDVAAAPDNAAKAGERRVGGRRVFRRIVCHTC
jgi:hypothetical protein